MHKKKCTQTGRTPTFSKEFRLYFRILEFDILLIVVVKSPRIGKKCPCLWTTRTQNCSVVSLDPSKAFNTFYHSLHSLKTQGIRCLIETVGIIILLSCVLTILFELTARRDWTQTELSPILQRGNPTAVRHRCAQCCDSEIEYIAVAVKTSTAL